MQDGVEPDLVWACLCSLAYLLQLAALVCWCEATSVCAMDQHAEQAPAGDRLARLRRALTRHRRTTSGSEPVHTPTAPDPRSPAPVPEPRSREGEGRPAEHLHTSILPALTCYLPQPSRLVESDEHWRAERWVGARPFAPLPGTLVARSAGGVVLLQGCLGGVSASQPSCTVTLQPRSAGGSGARAGAGLPHTCPPYPGACLRPRCSRAEDEREKEAALAALPPGYCSPEFGRVAAELGRACHLPFCPGACLRPGLLPAEDEREKEAALAALPPGYFTPEFDPVSAELGRLRPAFSEAELEAVVEARAAALEVVSERLSAHVLARYDSFITGVDEVQRLGVHPVVRFCLGVSGTYRDTPGASC